VRRLLGALVLAAPVSWIVWTDFVRRGLDIASFSPHYRLPYELGVAESFVMWSVLLFVASRRRGVLKSIASTLFVALFTLIIGVEAAFHAMWNSYLTLDGQLHTRSIFDSLFGALPLGRPLVIFHLVTTFAVAVWTVRFSRRFTKARAWSARLMTLAVLGSFYGVYLFTDKYGSSYRFPTGSPEDSLYLHSMLYSAKENLAIAYPEWAAEHQIERGSTRLHVTRRTPEAVPPLTAAPAKKRNVVLILEESQRDDVTCNDHDARCDRSTPWSNAVTKNRMPLDELHSNASTTAISISTLWSGLRPTDGHDELLSAPLLWDYAAAAGYDTAYWTSQNLMFGNARLYVEDLPISHGAAATTVDAGADLDAGARDTDLTEWVKRDWPEMREPFFAVVHYSNPHVPYLYDKDFAPFQPAERNYSPEKNTEYENYYKDAVYLSDVAVGELVRYIRSTDAGKRTVIVYTADHGEAFREHWQTCHTFSTYEEEVHVPGWIDAPPGTLSDDEKANIEHAQKEYVWHLDFAPTFLDLLGVWEDPALKSFKAKMPGHPITRSERTLAPVVMTNCSWVWECEFRNWGMMQGPRKIEAREWDGQFHCFDVAKDPNEVNDLGEEACAPLPDLARSIFHVMPNVTPPGKKPVDWGQ